MIIDIILGTNQLLTYLTDIRCPMMSKDTSSVVLVKHASSSLHLEHKHLSSMKQTHLNPYNSHTCVHSNTYFQYLPHVGLHFFFYDNITIFLKRNIFMFLRKSQRNIKGKHGAKNKHLSLTNIYQTKQAIQDNLCCTKYEYKKDSKLLAITKFNNYNKCNRQKTIFRIEKES